MEETWKSVSIDNDSACSVGDTTGAGPRERRRTVFFRSDIKIDRFWRENFLTEPGTIFELGNVRQKRAPAADGTDRADYAEGSRQTTAPGETLQQLSARPRACRQ